jgi:hypothetical protein
MFRRAARRRTTFAALAAIAAAILFVLLSSGTAPANADYNHPCLPAQVNTGLDPAAPYYDTWVQAATDTSPDGQVGVCVRPIGGCGAVSGVPCLFIGAGVGGNLVSGDPTMTGVLVQPQACAEANPGVNTCVTEGTTGAEANTSGAARVCVEQICQRVN